MGNSSSVDLALAKRVAADVKAGLAPKEALLPFKELLLDSNFREFLGRLDPSLVRFLNLARRSSAPGDRAPRTPVQVSHDPVGQDFRLYLSRLPGEAQLRVAYEVAIEAFLEYLETRGFALLEKRVGTYRLYAPIRDFKEGELEDKLKLEWETFLKEKYLSLEGLFSSLGLLLEGSQLAPRGFSVPKVPLVTEGMRIFLGGWYWASIEEAMRGSSQEELAGVLEKKLEDLNCSKTRKSRSKGKAKPTGEHPEDPPTRKPAPPEKQDSFERLRAILEKHPSAEQIRRAALWFGRTARSQLNTKKSDIFGKAVEAFLSVLDEPLDQIPPPLQIQGSAVLKDRPPGDRAKVCYGCGQPIKEGYKVSKLIFSSPSQRLQSGYGQEEPKVCATCAVLGLASPLKFGEGAVIVRVRAPLTSLEEAKAFARMEVLGSLNIAAGPYIQLNSPSVRTGNERRPLAQVVGRVVYALAYIGREVNPSSLQRLDLEVLEGGQPIPLPRAALWLSHLYQMGFGARIDESGEANRDLAEALRYALAGLPWHGEYVLARRYGQVKDPIRLEEGRRDYAELLDGGKSMAKLAERLKDVAGLTGLLYAWADYVRRKAPNRKREIAKFLENLESPYSASYVASYTLDETQATLYRNHDRHFLYGEALRLLREADVEAREEDGKLFVSQDDLAKAYTHLAQKYEAGWKEFIYEVRLALASRFPEYIRAEKEG